MAKASLRSDGFVARIRWAAMPWWAMAWRFRDDFADAPVPGNWWQHCVGSIAWWADKILERLPGAALFPPMPPIVCDCEDCRAADRMEQTSG